MPMVQLVNTGSCIRQSYWYGLKVERYLKIQWFTVKSNFAPDNHRRPEFWRIFKFPAS